MDCGVLSNQSPHMIDRMMWLAGDVEEVLSATCDCGKERKIEAETVAVATLRLKNGALATITGTTLAYEGLSQRLLICGTEGSVSFEADDIKYFKTSRPFAGAPQAITNVEEAGRASSPLAMSSDGHLGNIRDFVMAIHENRPPAVTGEDYRKVTWLLNQIYEKAGVGPYAKK